MKRWPGDLGLIVGLGLVLGWPTVAMIWQAGLDLRSGPSVGMAASRPLGLVVETLKLVGLTEILAIPAGVGLGWLLFRTDVFGRRALLFLMGVSLFVPMPLHAVGWLGSFGNLGRSQAIGSGPILVGLGGAAFVHAIASIPWVVLLSGVGLRSVEAELEDSALIELPAWKVAWFVTLRRGVGAITGAAIAVAVLTAGDMTVTDLLQVRSYAEEAYLQGQLGLGQGAAGLRVTLPMLVVLGGAIFLAARALIRADPSRLPSAEVRSRTWSLGRWRMPVGVVAVLIVGNAVALPVYGLIWRAGRVGASRIWSVSGLLGSIANAWPDLTAPTAFGEWWETLDSRPLVGTALWTAAGASMAVVLAWSLAWKSRGRGPWSVVAAVSMAILLATPGPVVGVALKRAYLMVPIIHDTTAILVLAFVARVLPYTFLVLWPAIRSIPSEHLESAQLDGMGPIREVWSVGLPSTRGAIVAAWGVAFAIAMGELPASNFVAPPGHFSVALEVWRLLHTGVESRLAAIGLILLGFAASAGLVAVGLLAWAYRIILPEPASSRLRSRRTGPRGGTSSGRTRAGDRA